MYEIVQYFRRKSNWYLGIKVFSYSVGWISCNPVFWNTLDNAVKKIIDLEEVIPSGFFYSFRQCHNICNLPYAQSIVLSYSSVVNVPNNNLIMFQLRVSALIPNTFLCSISGTYFKIIAIPHVKLREINFQTFTSRFA